MTNWRDGMANGEGFTKEREREVLAALENVGVLNMCPLCRQSGFQLFPGYFVNIVQQDIGVVKLEGKSIPVVILMCKNCGFVSQHSLASLGLLPEGKVGGRDG